MRARVGGLGEGAHSVCGIASSGDTGVCPMGSCMLGELAVSPVV